MSSRLLTRRSMMVTGAGLTVAVAAAFHLPASAGSPVRPAPFATGAFSASAPGSYALGADNTDSSDPFNDYGVEGKVDNDVGGVGILGYGQRSKSYGVYGVTFGQNGIGVYGASDGPTPGPGATPDATTISTGLAGDSHAGSGIFGTTEWPADSNAFSNPVAGVEGIDDAPSGGTNDGVYGKTTSGGYGVVGFGGVGAFGGVAGEAVGNPGVYGSSDNGQGVFGYSATGIGVVGQSGESYGVEGFSNTNDAVVAISTTAIGVAGESTSSDGVYASTSASDNTHAAVYALGGHVSIESIASTAFASATESFPFLSFSSDGQQLVAIDNKGNTSIVGELSVHGGTTTYARTRDASMQVQAYVPSSSAPTTEDYGSGRAVGGVAYVRLDPAFARSIDDRTPYKVFVTADGDMKGFFVTGKSLSGFSVREAQGGRDSFDFDYRIVATQYGQSGHRAALVAESLLDAQSVRGRPGGTKPPVNLMPKRSAKQVDMEAAARADRANHAFLPSPNLAVEHRSR